ncbi:MAG TPA: NAD(+) diphosphatase, partial [Chthonomonadaceae bacterium]|nr:NAD(+) diphosphatase [Chthonomonadaceae bacterium]
MILQGGAILVEGDGEVRLPRGDALPADRDRLGEPVPLGLTAGREYLLAELAEDQALDEIWRAADLRSLYGRLPDIEWAIAGYATQVAHWQRTSRFCPVCGATMGSPGLEWRRRCPGCGHERYPIVSPAVLALVHDGDRILLAHKPGWGARRSILAGFVLPGESLEECVRREVLEEAGVEVDQIEYFGSQPWPFPQQLMIGFRTRYNSGVIRIDADELAGADWYDFRSMPP